MTAGLESSGDAERWNEKYRALEADAAGIHLSPPGALVGLSRHVPADGIAVDLAGGNGGGALWLAERGLEAVLVEVSDVAIEQAVAAATQRAATVVPLPFDLASADLADVLAAVPDVVGHGGPVSMVCCFHYLQRSLLQSVGSALPSGAIFMAAIATRTNLERHQRPSARFLLEPGELESLVVGEQRLEVATEDSGDVPSIDVLHSHEGWNEAGSHEAELVIRRR